MFDPWMAAWDLDDWKAVPGQVVSLHARHAKAASRVRHAYRKSARRVYWSPSTGRSSLDAPAASDYVLVKAAEHDWLRPAADAVTAVQKPLGGPNPLTTALLGGALGAGLGHVGGSVAESLLPDEFERGKLKRNLTLAGGLAGAVPGAVWGGVNVANSGNIGGGVTDALTSKWPFEHRASALAAGVDEWFLKAAEAGALLYAPTIPVDAFNRVVWSDAIQTPDPYGSKSSWGDNDQELRTPPWAAAAASGIISGAGAATGQRAVSPWQVAQAAAASAGTGYLTALAFGKTLGALAGLRPEAQERLRDLGLWGGLVTGAVRGLFGQ